MNATLYVADEASSAYRPKIRSMLRLQWEPAQNAHVLLYPEGMVKLNQSAAEVLKRCDGTRNLDTLIVDLEREFNATAIAAEVHAFVADARTRGWLE
jgi:pyrroloquinoline quinone biosynthesis protein D